MLLSKERVRLISDSEAAQQGVLEFRPKPLGGGLQRAARDYIQRTAASETTSPFILNPLIADQVGVADIERREIERKLELSTLERLKTLEESAYKEAFELGKEEGKQQAYGEASKEIQAFLEQMKTLLESIKNLLPVMVTTNESRIVTLVNEVASRIALARIVESNESIVSALKEVSGSVSSDESMTIELNPADVSVAEHLLKAEGRDWEFLKMAKFVPLEHIKRGGCVVQTNYGVIDATLEERVKRTYDALNDRKPKTKDKFE